MCDGVRTELITFICFITALNTNEHLLPQRPAARHRGGLQGSHIPQL